MPSIAQTEALTSLMQQAQHGDKAAYARLLKECASLLRPFLSKRLNSSFEVDDVLQEILISIHKARHTYDGTRPVLPWIYAIAQFRLQDHFRMVYGDELIGAIDISEIEESLAASEVKETLSFDSLEKLINQLPQKTALILRLIHQQGHTAQEVASQLGMSESAVKVAAHRAYKNLREQLEQTHGQNR